MRIDSLLSAFRAALVLLAATCCLNAAHAQQGPSPGALLDQIHRLSEQALEASRAAEQAATVADVKRGADAVFAAIWGQPSGLAADGAWGEAEQHGWKVRWQVDNTEFDSAFAARYGTLPPAISDPQALGIMGRARYVRRQLEGDFAHAPTAGLDSLAARAIIVPLNNAIGWMKMDDGFTKGETQPRVDLTREWDAPSEFWLSTADTGYLNEVYAQAINILKTDYQADVAEARRHAAGMTQLLQKYIDGVDADGDGAVEAVMMEGGLGSALAQARAAGLLQ